MFNIEELKETILSIKDSNGHCYVAIDGRCGSGKSTLAKQLSEELDAPIFHMDDFFLRISQRTKERYEEPGGNVDRERFKEEVIDSLVRQEDIIYQPFDCQVFELEEKVTVNYNPIVIVEGSYSCHPELIDYYDYKIFVDIDPKTQIERIRKRNGEEKLKVFIEKWIPLEELYFKTFEIDKKCDVIIDVR